MESDKAIKISMIKYNEKGMPLDAVHGFYSPRNIQMLKNEGFKEAEEELVKKINKELSDELMR